MRIKFNTTTHGTDKATYRRGQAHDLPEDRAKAIVDRGLAEAAPEASPAVPAAEPSAAEPPAKADAPATTAAKPAPSKPARTEK